MKSQRLINILIAVSIILIMIEIHLLNKSVDAIELKNAQHNCREFKK